jgi:hypothetical protein
MEDPGFPEVSFQGAFDFSFLIAFFLVYLSRNRMVSRYLIVRLRDKSPVLDNNREDGDNSAHEQSNDYRRGVSHCSRDCVRFGSNQHTA